MPSQAGNDTSVTLATMDVINLADGEISVVDLPNDGRGGCAVQYDGYLYWVRAASGIQSYSTDVYRALSESGGVGGLQIRWDTLYWAAMQCDAMHCDAMQWD